LFDYAVARLFLRGTFTEVIARLETEPDLLLALRPSLIFHYQYLWGLDQNHNSFWDCVFTLQHSGNIPATGKIVGPLVGAQLINTVSDCRPLLEAMKNESSPNHVASKEAFRQLVGAAHSSNVSGIRQISGPNAPPWCELLKEVAVI
jgi:hypothetical protein